MGINWGSSGKSTQAPNSFLDANRSDATATNIVSAASNVNGIEVAGGNISIMDGGPTLLVVVTIPPFYVEPGVALTWSAINGSNTANTYIYKAGDTSKKLFNFVPNNVKDNGGGVTPTNVTLTLAYRLL